jgi:hypothetical protein
MSNKEIARDLDLAVGTVKVHVAGLFRSLGVKNRAAAAAARNPLRIEHRRASAVSPTQFVRNYVVRYQHDLLVERCHLTAPH